MAREKQQQASNGNTTLALSDPQEGSAVLATVDTLDALAAVEGFDELGITDDGLTEVGSEDIKLPMKVFNMKGTLANGDPIPKNQFFDTVTEQLTRTLDVVLLKTHKTNEWREYDEVADKSVIRCRSFDRVTGTMDDGATRKCEGCRDAQWENVTTKDGKQKRTRRCGPVHNVFAIELATFQPCLIRFKRTALPVIQNYMSRHHIGRRPVRDPKTGKIKLGNYPFYSFACKVSLKMSDNGMYAVPVLERGQVLSAELIGQAANTVTYVNDVLLSQLNRVVDSDKSADDGDASFDPAGFGGGDGKDFVDAPASAE